MNLSGPEQSVNFDLFLNFAKDITLPRMFLSGSLPSHMTCLLRFTVQRERVNFPPLHLPSVKMVEIKARAVSHSIQLSNLSEVLGTS